MMNLLSVSETAAMLRAANNILIVTHIRPDGDTAGSGCALCLGLRALGKTAYIAENHASMQRYTYLLQPYFPPADFTPDFIAAVDIASAGQFPPGHEALAARTDLAVDHHGTNSGYARCTLLQPEAAAAGEAIFDILQALGVELTPTIAEALYTALATDSNCFRTAGTTGRTLQIAAQLHDVGFDVTALNRRLFETRSQARLRLEAYLFGSMRFPRPGLCLMILPYDTIVSLGVTEDDMDKLSTLTTAPEGTQIGVLLRQLGDGRWKTSLRTGGVPHAGEILHTLGGGGHADAAGTVLSGSAEELAERVLAAVDNYVRKT